MSNQCNNLLTLHWSYIYIYIYFNQYFQLQLISWCRVLIKAAAVIGSDLKVSIGWRKNSEFHRTFRFASMRKVSARGPRPRTWKLHKKQSPLSSERMSNNSIDKSFESPLLVATDDPLLSEPRPYSQYITPKMRRSAFNGEIVNRLFSFRSDERLVLCVIVNLKGV